MLALAKYCSNGALDAIWYLLWRGIEFGRSKRIMLVCEGHCLVTSMTVKVDAIKIILNLSSVIPFVT